MEKEEFEEKMETNQNIQMKNCCFLSDNFILLYVLYGGSQISDYII